MTSCDIELALTGFHSSPFPPRRYFVVPNISWGWGFRYEADLIAVNGGNRVIETEIKVSASDLRADPKKEKWRRIPAEGGMVPLPARGGLDGRVWKFCYAVPMKLVPVVETLEGGCPGAGIIGVKDDKTCEWVRRPKPISTARKVTAEEMVKLGHLVAMRYWDQREANKRILDTRADAWDNGRESADFEKNPYRTLAPPDPVVKEGK